MYSPQALHRLRLLGSVATENRFLQIWQLWQRARMSWTLSQAGNYVFAQLDWVYNQHEEDIIVLGDEGSNAFL